MLTELGAIIGAMTGVASFAWSIRYWRVDRVELL
jgi:hypothetical protein